MIDPFGELTHMCDSAQKVAELCRAIRAGGISPEEARILAQTPTFIAADTYVHDHDPDRDGYVWDQQESSRCRP